MGVGVGRPQYTTMEQAGIFLIRPRGDLLGGGERTKRGGDLLCFHCYRKSFRKTFILRTDCEDELNISQWSQHSRCLNVIGLIKPRQVPSLNSDLLINFIDKRDKSQDGKMKCQLLTGWIMLIFAGLRWNVQYCLRSLHSEGWGLPRPPRHSLPPSLPPVLSQSRPVGPSPHTSHLTTSPPHTSPPPLHWL